MRSHKFINSLLYLIIPLVAKESRANENDGGIKFFFFYIYKFNIKIYNLRITYDYERSTIQYHKTMPRGAKDYDYPRAIHMKNINLKLQLNIQLRETITNNGTMSLCPIYRQALISGHSL